jgi:hypothetical protein
MPSRRQALEHKFGNLEFILNQQNLQFSLPLLVLMIFKGRRSHYAITK